MTLIGLVGLVVTALFVDRDHVGGLEERAFREVNDGVDAPFTPVWVVMQLGSVLIVPIVALGALLARRPRLAATTAVAGIVVYVLGKVVRHIVVRERPARILDDVVIRGSPSLGTGYLSGHTALAVTMAVLLTPYLGRMGRWVAWLLAAAVGLGRIYVGAHLPLDVLGGAALGLTIAGLVTLLLWTMPSRRGNRAPAGAGQG